MASVHIQERVEILCHSPIAVARVERFERAWLVRTTEQPSQAIQGWFALPGCRRQDPKAFSR